MVTCKLYGGLGNNLFQISCVLAYVLRHNMEYFIPNIVQNPHYDNQGAYIFADVNYSDQVIDFPVYKEPHFHYAEIPKFENVILDGYFQSEKYFSDFRKEIMQAFDIPFYYETKENVCSIHIRRGDYLNFPNIHPVVSEEYLCKSIAEVFNKTGCKDFLVFSDDMEWCKKYFRNIYAISGEADRKQMNFEFSEGKNELQDMATMASCAHNICANSSFSWWAAWFNRNTNKVVVMPERWFGKDLQHNTKDIYLPNCTIL